MQHILTSIPCQTKLIKFNYCSTYWSTTYLSVYIYIYIYVHIYDLAVRLDASHAYECNEMPVMFWNYLCSSWWSKHCMSVCFLLFCLLFIPPEMLLQLKMHSHSQEQTHNLQVVCVHTPVHSLVQHHFLLLLHILIPSNISVSPKIVHQTALLFSMADSISVAKCWSFSWSFFKKIIFRKWLARKMFQGSLFLFFSPFFCWFYFFLVELKQRVC